MNIEEQYASTTEVSPTPTRLLPRQERTSTSTIDPEVIFDREIDRRLQEDMKRVDALIEQGHDVLGLNPEIEIEIDELELLRSFEEHIQREEKPHRNPRGVRADYAQERDAVCRW